VRSLTELCSLRVSVASYVTQSALCNASAASALDSRSVTADTFPGASHVGVLTSPVDALPCGNGPSAVVAWKPHRELPGLY
jgi:hypothetical protein